MNNDTDVRLYFSSDEHSVTGIMAADILFSPPSQLTAHLRAVHSERDRLRAEVDRLGTELRRALADAMQAWEQAGSARSAYNATLNELEAARADAAWWHATVANYVTSATVADREIIRDTMAEALRYEHPSAAFQAKLDAAHAVLRELYAVADAPGEDIRATIDEYFAGERGNAM